VADADATIVLNVPLPQNQQVTVRRLPDGDSHAASLNSLNNQLLGIHLERVPDGADVNPGDLVEVSGPKTLYLGEVRSRQGESVMISVEHALDLETLGLIRQVWHGPASQ
jgi:hypothetical protein